MLKRKRTGNLEYDPDLQAWVAVGQKSAHRRIDAEKHQYAGDSFMGGFIMGLAGSGVMWCLMMSLIS